LKNRVDNWNKKLEKVENANKKSKKEGVESLTDDQRVLLEKKTEYKHRKEEAEYIYDNVCKKATVDEKEKVNPSVKKEETVVEVVTNKEFQNKIRLLRMELKKFSIVKKLKKREMFVQLNIQ